MTRHLEVLLLTVLVAIFVVWFAWPLVWSASADSRLVDAFGSDEWRDLQLVKQAITQGTLRLDIYIYGHLYYNIALLPLLFLSYFMDVSDQQITVTLRLISTAFAVATVVMTFLLTRRYFGRPAAWLASLLLATVALEFLRWSATLHPDTTQMFFLVLGVYFCCRLAEEERWKWLILASAAAGLAFATKYNGIFLMPIILMIIVAQTVIGNLSSGIQSSAAQFARIARSVTAAVGVIGVLVGIVVTPDLVARYLTVDGVIEDLSKVQFLNSSRTIAFFLGGAAILLAIPGFIWSTIAQRATLAYILSKILNRVSLSFAIFGVAVIVTAPFLLARLNFLHGMIYGLKVTQFGHVFRADLNGLLWFDLLSSPQLLDGIILSLAAISLVWTVYSGSSMGWRRLLSPEFIMWAWVIFFMSVLIFRVNIRIERYLLPILPFLIILSTQVVSRAIAFTATRLSAKQVAVFTGAFLIIIVGLELPGSVDRIFEYRQSTAGREQTSVAVKAGQWLAQQYPPSTRILYDFYSYVPLSFPDTFRVAGGATIEMLETVKPDIVVVNKREVSDIFSDIGRAPLFAEGEEAFKRKHDYYEGMRNENLGYALASDFGDIQVYEKR